MTEDRFGRVLVGHGTIRSTGGFAGEAASLPVGKRVLLVGSPRSPEHFAIWNMRGSWGDKDVAYEDVVLLKQEE